MNNYQTTFRRKLKDEDCSGFFYTNDQQHLSTFLIGKSETPQIGGAHDEIKTLLISLALLLRKYHLHTYTPCVVGCSIDIDIGGYVCRKHTFSGLGYYPETRGEEAKD